MRIPVYSFPLLSVAYYNILSAFL